MNRSFLKSIKLILIIISLSVFGCKKYLDLKPESKLDNDYVFSNVNGAKASVMGIYNKLIMYEDAPIRFYPYTADDAMANTSGGLDNAVKSIYRYDLRSTNTQLAATYNGLYAGIDRANVCIKEIPLMEMYTSGSAEEIAALKRLLGEALTLRSLFYFDLIRNWGDVPASFSPASAQEDLFIEKTEREIIYDRIIDDLAEAAALLPWRNDAGVQSDERITKGAAKALRARIALFAGGFSLRKDKTMKRPDNYRDYYEIANQECRELYERRDKHTLNPSFEGVFRSLTSYQIEPNGEVMLEIGFSVNNAGMLGYFDGPRYQFPGMDARGGSVSIYFVPTLFYAFGQQDLRRDVTAAPYWTDFINEVRIGTTLAALSFGKFRVDWTVPLLNSRTTKTGINFPIIRFSDVLLMYAETENELNNGPTPIAISSFEEVRKRAYGNAASEIGTTPTDKSGFFDAIVKERLLEFAGEGIRKYDLIRWSILGTKLDQTREELTKMKNRQAPYNNLPTGMRYKQSSFELIWANSFYSPTPSGSVPAGYTNVGWLSSVTDAIISGFAPFFEKNKNELLPIPQSAIDANPKLTQDYGY
ncbi:MAG: RagB/SusD family nutrient uptake outer membrane protein [Niabella sp.]